MGKIGKLVDQVCEHIETENPIHVSQDDLEIVMDKIVPYLVLYRFEKEPESSIQELLRAHSFYLIAKDTVDLEKIISCTIPIIKKKYGAFLIMEVIPDREGEKISFCYRSSSLEPTMHILKEQLSSFKFRHHRLNLTISPKSNELTTPPIELYTDEGKGVLWIGVGLPNWFGYGSEAIKTPLLFREFKKHFGTSLKKAAFEFTRVQSKTNVRHYQEFGRTHFGKLGKQIDLQLAEISDQLNFLLNVSPNNSQEAYLKFQERNYEEEPSFIYRIIQFDPEAFKKRIFQLPVEKIHDPTVASLFRDKILEIEKILLLIESRETADFKYFSQSLFGAPDDKLLSTAHYILNNLQVEPAEEKTCVDHITFVKRAREEMDHYKAIFKDVPMDIDLREDISGLMVSNEKLLVSNNLSIAENRVEALIQHEVGTHLLTYCNGKRQNFKLLYTGLAGYDELQEGLAVQAEVVSCTGSRGRLHAQKHLLHRMF